MKITPAEKIMGAVLVLAATAYVGYKFFVAPPLVIFSLNPIDGSGEFRFGEAIGHIAAGGYDGGWGWTLSFASFAPGAGWMVQVMKGGAIRKTMVINRVGTMKVV